MKLLAVLDCEALLQPSAGEAPWLLEPGSREAVMGQDWAPGRARGNRIWLNDKLYKVQESSKSTLALGGKAPPPSVSVQCPLLRGFGVRPASRGDVFKGPCSIFTEQAMKGESSRWHSPLLPLHSFQWLPFYTHVTPLQQQNSCISTCQSSSASSCSHLVFQMGSLSPNCLNHCPHE